MGLQANPPTPPVTTYVKNIEMAANPVWNSAVSGVKAKFPGEEPTILGNLNSGCGTQYVALGYTTTPTASQAITGIVAVCNDRAYPNTTVTVNGITYNLVGIDTNAGAGGDYIWLYATRDNRAGAPIKSLYLELNGTLSINTSEGWSTVNWTSGSRADMNKGAGGDYVYIWMQR
jgi:hypothetical protein